MNKILKSVLLAVVSFIALTSCNLVHDLSEVWDKATFDDRLSGRWGKENSSTHDRQFMFIPKDGMHEAFDISQSWFNSLEKDDTSRVVSNLLSFLDFRQVRAYEYLGKSLLLSKRVGDNRGEVFAYSINDDVLTIRTINADKLIEAVKGRQIKGSILSESSVSTYFTFPNSLTPKEMAEIELISKAIDTHARPVDPEEVRTVVLHTLDTETLDYIVSIYDNEEYWTALEPLHKLEDANGKWIVYFQAVDCISIVTDQMAEAALEMGITKP